MPTLGKTINAYTRRNAYINMLTENSGMREDLHIVGNQLNYNSAALSASYCTFMISACYFMTHYPANIVLPVLEIDCALQHATDHRYSYQHRFSCSFGPFCG